MTFWEFIWLIFKAGLLVCVGIPFMLFVLLLIFLFI